MVTFEEAFWAKINKNGPVPSHKPSIGQCWQWFGNRTSNNYGQVKWTPRHKNRMLAHRASWLIHKGEIPELCVLHKCDNRLCVNPNHLFLGTQKDNIQDCLRKGRLNPGGGAPQNGENNFNAKLSNVDVFEIRRRYSQEGSSVKFLAKAFGVSDTSIRMIIRRKTWKCI